MLIAVLLDTGVGYSRAYLRARAAAAALFVSNSVLVVVVGRCIVSVCVELKEHG